MIEFFVVTPAEDGAFHAAWSAAAPPTATLHQALRDDVQPQYAALDPGGPVAGVLLLVEFAGEPDAWAPLLARWSPRQGCISARVDGGVAVVHWSSPLMYDRAVRALGDLVAALPFDTRAALYRHVRAGDARSGPRRT